ncbi:hypothetical protein JOD69_000886 [Methylocaldum sp. RMAD-M]|nr:hypothetical protein [Methylocaldum sp. RMAD-M]
MSQFRWAVIPAGIAGIQFTGIVNGRNHPWSLDPGNPIANGPLVGPFPAGVTTWLLPDGGQAPLRGQPSKATGFAGGSLLHANSNSRNKSFDFSQDRFCVSGFVFLSRLPRRASELSAGITRKGRRMDSARRSRVMMTLRSPPAESDKFAGSEFDQRYAGPKGENQGWFS